MINGKLWNEITKQQSAILSVSGDVWVLIHSWSHDMALDSLKVDLNPTSVSGWMLDGSMSVLPCLILISKVNYNHNNEIVWSSWDWDYWNPPMRHWCITHSNSIRYWHSTPKKLIRVWSIKVVANKLEPLFLKSVSLIPDGNMWIFFQPIIQYGNFRNSSSHLHYFLKVSSSRTQVYYSGYSYDYYF